MPVLPVRARAYFALVIVVIIALGSPMFLPNATASVTTLFSDNFESDRAVAGPVYSWNNPVGASNYVPSTSQESYPPYTPNLSSVLSPASAGGCTQNVNWTIDPTAVNNGQGSLAAGTYYLSADLNLGGYGNNNWNFVPSVGVSDLGTQGEVPITVSGSDNALSLTVKENSTAIGVSTGGWNSIKLFRVFITTTVGNEIKSSDYFNVTYSSSGVTFTIYSLTTASQGIHGVGVIDRCDPWFEPGDRPYVLAPNSIFAVTSERSHSGSNSLLMGVSDDGYDKTSTSIRLSRSAIPFPSNNILQFSMAVWLSGSNSSQTGVCNTANQKSTIIIVLLGNNLVYRCHMGSTYGFWSWSNDTQIGAYSGTYFLTTQTWHTITISLDISNSMIKYYDLTVDANDVGATFPNFKGSTLYAGGLGKAGPIGPKGIWIFPFWINTQGVARLSRATAGNSEGAYMYVDDISISLTPMSTMSSTTGSTVTSTPVTTIVTSSITPVTATSISSTTTQTSTSITTVITSPSPTTVSSITSSTTLSSASTTVQSTITGTKSTTFTSTTSSSSRCLGRGCIDGLSPVYVWPFFSVALIGCCLLPRYRNSLVSIIPGRSENSLPSEDVRQTAVRS